MTDTKDKILVEIQKAITHILGNSSAALMRKAGTSASCEIWPELPSGKTIKEAGEIMKHGIDSLGDFGEFSIIAENEGVVSIEFKNCYFARFTEKSGKPCGQQPICFFGFGLVEETFKRLTGIQTKVELMNREDGTEVCFETATPR